MPTLADLGEFEVIRRLVAARGAGPADPALRLGPGDDAALWRPAPGRDLALTTDAFVEGRHYREAWITPADLGARLAAANLSDLAAMAATPRLALLSLGVRPAHDADALVALQAGLAGALAAHGAVIAGGNLVAVEGAEWMSLTLLGEAVVGGEWQRAGARPGDLLAVTGAPGRAGAAVRLLDRFGPARVDAEWPELARAWRSPAPRVRFAAALVTSGVVRAAMDLSDGLAGDLAHLCAASEVGAILDREAWPMDPALAAAAAALQVDAHALREGASDDYELLLAVAPDGRDTVERVARAHGAPLAFIGRLVSSEGSARPDARGFDHFQR